MRELRDFDRLAESQSALCTDYIKLLYYDLPQFYKSEYHSYEAPRLCTILDGVKEVKINDTEAFAYAEDGFILLPPHSEVQMYMPEHTKAIVYEFDENLIEHVSQKVGDQLQLSMDKSELYASFSLHQQNNRIQTLTNRIQDIFIENDRNMGFLVDLACQELVYELLKMDGCQAIIQSQKNHPIHKAIQLMNTHPERIGSLQEIAFEINMSPSNFTQQFKTVTGVNPSDYLTEVKLKKARQMLNQMAVTEVAYELGYQNISHFIKLFKLQNGVTPKQYQLKKGIKI